MLPFECVCVVYPAARPAVNACVISTVDKHSRVAEQAGIVGAEPAGGAGPTGERGTGHSMDRREIDSSVSADGRFTSPRRLTLPWPAWLEDLDARADAEWCSMEAEHGIALRREAEAQVGLSQRLLAALGVQVRAQPWGAPVVGGRLDLVGVDHIQIGSATETEQVVPLAALLWLELPDRRPATRAQRPLAQGWTLRAQLRQWSGRKAQLRLDLRDGSVLHGIAGRVGADQVELRLNWPDGSRSARVALVPFAAMSVLYAGS